MGPSTNFPAHIAVLGGGKIGVEVLAGLDTVLGETARRNGKGKTDHPIIFIGGLRTRTGSGSPVRVQCSYRTGWCSSMVLV